MINKTDTIRVFISYAREDQNIAKRLYNYLKDYGISPWMDAYNLQVGQNWKTEIRKAIKNSNFFIALLSNISISKRGYVQKELKKAFNILDEFPPEDIFVLPVRIDDCKPVDERLENLQWGDLFPDFEIGLKKIISVILSYSKDFSNNEYKYREERYIDAAISEYVVVGEQTELLTMIRLPESQGLKNILKHQFDFQSQPDEVKSKNFSLEYPVDVNGNIKNLNLLIEIETNDFILTNNQKKISVEASKDSDYYIFLLTPCKRGSLKLIIQLYYTDIIIASALIKTNSTDLLDKGFKVIKKIISLPLGVFGITKGDKINGDKIEINSGGDVTFAKGNGKVSIIKSEKKYHYSYRGEPRLITEYDIQKILEIFSVHREKDYTDNGDGTVTDNATGLMWHISASNDAVPFKEVQEYINMLNKKKYASYSDWRIPTLEELMSLLEEEEQSNGFYINPLFGKKRFLWSSDKNEVEQLWFLDFGSKDIYALDDFHCYIKAVRYC